MNLTKSIVVAGVLALFGGAANAATYTIDDLLGAADLGNSGSGTELSALADMIGVAESELFIDIKYDNGDGDAATDYVLAQDDAGSWYIDAPNNPGWFILKLGGGNGNSNDTPYTHFFFENIGELNKLVY